ncbi:MAG: chromosome segregation ATPase [Verrucomicrobiales bacterium]|jgi:chromosome segregation ATPase
MDSEKLRNRYRELKQDLESGQEQLRSLESRRNDLERTLLRISGAIQVLEELGVNDEETKNQLQKSTNSAFSSSNVDGVHG